ncbi:aromatic ring-hydroxylating dioxygenase subunit alpha [Frankia sp. AgB1.9]|uniref:aromatic ring-hydroxylating oxygenase subunit alpha n=1 Tax=unclassified Frankia TaxID=2632575 RepID=UPI0019317320|nr:MULTISPECIES: aromatic ring-hydroxylating dioxygenase subunit alpha [unclassified Frankia]MBL7488280.1 aromatic ring-hydroxylating dioxygenase subunit alpha [Frankia sp. AgW1.1]MBL7548566.1 aromatic ring-hydroxylating dioxygenase subunit alpha [Frankia sp. AgB1.9]MBL7619538.1 aromatic ring-hydroxylating dioxygenase subunit alpha [Frankia sp. AgB1.8]
MADVLTAPAASVTLPTDCSFEPDDWAILAQHWYPVALSREVGDQPVAARLLDERLVIYRAGAEVVVARDICPHRGVPLSMATGDGQSIACAYHGLRFGPAGACVAIPAHPQAKIPARMALTTFPAVERYGLVWTCLAPVRGAGRAVGLRDGDRRPGSAAEDGDDGTAGGRAGGTAGDTARGRERGTDDGTAGGTDNGTACGTAIPRMPHWDEPGFQRVTCPPFDVAAFAGRQVEGFLDVAHFAFVHTATFGDPNDTEVPEYSPAPTENGFVADYWSTVGNYPHGGRQGEPGFRWLRHFEAHLPFTATLVVHFPGEGRLSIMNAASPVSARRTRMFAPIAKNFDTGQPDQEIFDFNLRIFEEDRAIVEAQRPENLPLDPRIEVNIPADRSSVAYRRGLRALGLSHFFTA